MGAFTLNGKVNQVGKDGVDVGIDQDKTVATGWVATLVSNYPKGVPIPDGSDIDYITTRTITLLSDGSITEDGVTAGISLTAHDPDLFSTHLQWTIKPGVVTLTDNKTLRPKPWTFNAPLAGEAATLGGLTSVAGMVLLPVPGAVPWDDVTGKPTLLGLVQAAKNPDVLVTGAVTLDSNDLVTSAVVVWPDGSPGTLTITSRDLNSAVLAYNITYGSPVTETFTQPTITRNSNGAATNVPAIVIS